MLGGCFEEVWKECVEYLKYFKKKINDIKKKNKKVIIKNKKEFDFY